MELSIGILILLMGLGLLIRLNNNSTICVNDDKILKIIANELENDGIEYFELKSIVSLDNSNVTCVIVFDGYVEISIDVNNVTGQILHKEKIAS